MTIISNISTAQKSISLAEMITKQRKQLDRATQEMSTLRKADIFESRSSAPSKALEFRARMEINETYITSNKVLATKLEVMDDVLTSIRDDAAEFTSFLLTADSAAGNKDTLKDQAEMALRSISDKLNTSYGGEYVFSGSATGRPAIIIDAGLNAVYNGDTGDQLTARIDENTDLKYGTRGDNQAFEDMFAVLTSIATADFDAMSAVEFGDFREASIIAMGNASEAIIGVQTKVGDSQANLDRKIQSQENLHKIMNDNVLDIEGVDPEEAALKVESLRVQLQSTFEVTARMSQMSFLNYI